MGRHSKAAGSREFFTSGERQKAQASGDYGTIKQRLGAESQRAFDQCGLCTAPLRDPVATPYGTLYCRECIFTNLLSQKQALDERRRAYEEAQTAKVADEAAAEAGRQAAEITAFARREGGAVGADGTVASRPIASIGARAVAASAAVTAASTIHGSASTKLKIDSRDRDQKVTDVNRSAFWTPQSEGGSAVRAGSQSVEAPDPAPRDPVTGGFLRAKQLITVKLSSSSGLANGGSASSSSSGAGVNDDADAGGSSNGGGARYQCPGCSKPIVYQAMYLLKACGHCACGTCLTKLVAPSKACLQCGGPAASKSDIVKLQQGGSSYAGGAGTQAEAVKYKPTVF